MAYTSQTTMTPGDVLTAARMNEIRANFRYLKGEDGPITLSDKLTAPSLNVTGNIGSNVASPSCALDFGVSQANAKRILGIYTSPGSNLFAGIGMDGATAGIRFAGDPSGGLNPLLDIGSYSMDGSYTWTSRVMFTSGGNVGVGTTSPTARLHVSATSSQDALKVSSGVTRLGETLFLNALSTPLGFGGALYCNGIAGKTDGSGTWTIVSDVRAKNVRGDYTKGLAALRQIQPIRYVYNGRFGTDPREEHVGIIAQRIEKAFPEAVSRTTVRERDTMYHDFRTINIDAIIYTIINALKEVADHVGMP